MDNDWIQIFDNEYENISANIRFESETDRISENENVPIQIIMCQEKKNVKIFWGFLIECSAETKFILKDRKEIMLIKNNGDQVEINIRYQIRGQL